MKFFTGGLGGSLATNGRAGRFWEVLGIGGAFVAVVGDGKGTGCAFLIAGRLGSHDLERTHEDSRRRHGAGKRIIA